MSTIDQFESVFRSSIKPSYEPNLIKFEKILLVTDLEEEDAQRFLQDLMPLFTHLAGSGELEVTQLPKAQSNDVQHLIDEVNQRSLDLVVTHRHLHSNRPLTYTLGDHIEVLTQVTNVPILLFPHHSKKQDINFTLPDRVMVLTDQLDDHPGLIDAALTLVKEEGLISLAHIEDEAQYERYMNFISKIPEIDTQIARESIKSQIFKEAEDFVEVIKGTLQSRGLKVSVHSDIRMGHQLKTYVSMVELNHIDMVVMQSKDDDQIAIHGLSYPLAVELSTLPLLIM